MCDVCKKEGCKRSFKQLGKFTKYFLETKYVKNEDLSKYILKDLDVLFWDSNVPEVVFIGTSATPATPQMLVYHDKGDRIGVFTELRRIYYKS